MRVGLNGRELRGRPELRAYVEQRLLSTLGHLTRHVDCVAVIAESIGEGPKRGALRCRLWARLLRGQQLREEQTDVDLYAAIDRLAETLARDVEYVESRLPPGEALRCA
jgi:ribosome-associated translation inhibitor RaiA